VDNLPIVTYRNRLIYWQLQERFRYQIFFCVLTMVGIMDSVNTMNVKYFKRDGVPEHITESESYVVDCRS